MVAADGLPQVGSKVRLNASTWNGPTVVEGVLLAPSAEGCITVKLLNGYNVTHRLENVTELEVVAGPVAESAGDEGELVEAATPEKFFNNPQHERTKLFLEQIL